ncbi:hypothetical protein DFH07DRAFT_755583 [Mycena maculata]|uniref:Uncharacterized protein n=1 Tax=Mycena maculata TaxID=230809 RepID=A0AAD7I0Q5_9AGAR|nr:hypothetical protein DFH07DRAFT_755583 [Mycena maculata]
MVPTLPEGMSVQTLTTAKGTQLKFWSVKTNEAAEKKVLKISGSVGDLRAALAEYYGLDLTIIPRVNPVTAPTIDDTIRDRQWADLEALGVEWRETVKAGLNYFMAQNHRHLQTRFYRRLRAPLWMKERMSTLLITRIQSSGPNLMIAASNTPPHTIHSTFHPPAQHNHSNISGINPQSPHIVSPGPSNERGPSKSQHPHTVAVPSTINLSAPSSLTISSASGSRNDSQREAAMLDDLSASIEGLERCEGLRDLIQQVESGTVQAIRDRYGPSEPGRRGTAHESWPKYANLVSKREHLYRVLTQDFGGDKDKFFSFFTAPPPPRKKRKHIETESASSEYFRSFRRIVEAVPWRDADLAAERRKDQYQGPDGAFSEELWTARWNTMNCWEVWRAIGGECYVKNKAETSS